ncbi:MAG: ABC transporter ATP-binding protein [Actinomyces ruminicola]|uniref:ABC-2 type transport system ATP-binding protein n=1 Tax=Actinomyces ruminicola TaxID=332524 RepID=A0A1G9TJ50_9ACTO|nr:ABC transporter ATP-binding protein [Actinomyces ruminicola]MBE6481049.1 ABC transporter ATP-binding protein [Actinomyces ruminicola]SDM47662.1 ABC-2 type transport system ATP-binding protein [Actinomyces ruminicola]
MTPRQKGGHRAAVSRTNPPRADAPIRVQGLVKRFGRFTALDGLDLEVAAGQVHGFLGPNGAGKSTTIRALLGLYHPDGGRVRVLGRDPRREAPQINREVSYVAGDVALWPNLTGGQALDALAGLRGRRDRVREDELIERFALDPTKKVRTYSKGNRQKVALVAALAAPTSLLILDEPTSGLDPLMEQVFMDEVTRAAAQGRTVLLSSHIFAEVQRLCSAVTIIKDGRVVEQGDLARLQQLARTQIEVGGDADLLRGIAASLPQLEDELSVEDGRLSVQVGSARVPAVLAAVAAQGATDVICRPASLEDLFLRHYEEVRG